MIAASPTSPDLSAVPDPHPIAEGLADRGALRIAITAAYRVPEPQALTPLLEQATLPAAQAAVVQELALRVAHQLRTRKQGTGRAGLVQGLLQEYALSSQEGVALMCLAEALLRIPDTATRNALIRDKISHGQWGEHAGRSPSLFVNAATWGLLLTGKLVATHSEVNLSALLTRLIAKGGEPMIRKGVDMAMRMMGEQFVTGETMPDALRHAESLEAQGFRYSYDMLGEAAMTAEDAERYRRSYEQAIHAIGKASKGRGVYAGPGISVKLSALHPRYSRAQYTRVMNELYPVLYELALLAKGHGIGLNIDAEESDRLELSLDLLEQLCAEPALVGWNGIGFVIQAYQKRCIYVIDYLIDLARRSSHRLMVRLVKGAYWDSEVKRAQVDGQPGFPVFTRKVHTDVSYLACARKLLHAPQQIYPQFATHNAHTMAAIYTLADPENYWPGQYEFQCLHGMGEPLYEQVVGPLEDGKLDRPCRIYAPVGTHETLLAYLVRRLLENGANTSFVNRVADPSLPIETLIEDPTTEVRRKAEVDGVVGLPHPAIPAPGALYGEARRNSEGIDLSSEEILAALDASFSKTARAQWSAAPMPARLMRTADDSTVPVRNPADHNDLVGTVRPGNAADIDAALAAAAQYASNWAATPCTERACMLERGADLLQQRMPSLLGLLAREAGKTFSNGVSEVREAIDFLRFYAAQARADFDSSTHRPLGPVVCISPWNFPLAIFLGQIAAALAAGNPVVAKPAEQTPLIAAEAVRLLHQAGIPPDALQLIPGEGPVGAALVADVRTQGVMFTGSTEVARLIQRTLAERLAPTGSPIPLIAETGGQNAMIVDSSALAEQVVTDVLTSAFDSAGQRCSALRVLCIQEDIADGLLRMLKGAVSELVVGDPSRLQTDVGPVIDADAKASIDRHVQEMEARGHSVHRLGKVVETRDGTFVMPTLIELDNLVELEREVFGPVLHVLRYRRRDLSQLIAQINATGYGLTLGLHTRIDETIAKVTGSARVGNMYVNRNMVGAVVGVQPFGGEGLSGTGPKAGGPLYLYRLLSSSPSDVLGRALKKGLPGSTAIESPARIQDRFMSLMRWVTAEGYRELVEACSRFEREVSQLEGRVLIGPTGERNTYVLEPRTAVLCVAEADDACLFQTAAALAVGCRVIWPSSLKAQNLHARLPQDVRSAVAMASDWAAASADFEVVLHQGSDESLRSVAARLSNRPGPIISLRRFAPNQGEAPIEALLTERSISLNTAAAGGNASLMTIA